MSPQQRRRRPVFHRLAVAGVEPLCADAAAVTFAVPPELAGEFAFRPGQALTLRRTVDGRDERRSYSICAAAGEPLRIGVREVPGGIFSSWLVHGVRPGDEVEVLPPSGGFTPELTTPARHALVAAGSGITPMLSIAASVLAADEGSTVVLFYGNRRTDTVMFTEELADLKDRHPARFQLVHVLSREPREAELLSGRLDRERLAALVGAFAPPSAVDHWWLCGPLAMTEGARALLLDEWGVPAERVHRELFHADDEPAPEPLRHPDGSPAGPTTRAAVTLDGRTSSAAVPRDVPLLDALQRTRPDLPFACKGGVCGTCRARLGSGEVRMRRNYALEPAETAAGYVLTCQSLPLTDQVELDFDS
ncbi:1,2-phenylacetyl-CoA epoxidase subunit PaaE [Phaeacidiphilus oryzae]|uniref:1,2-phenylacetyl-CoA epoxidase subunit PaaE n=1 Tax=Phaeacidiphilus oryzae TaxID=348818 RepID=UPI0005622DEC|nr:1,2-phenylacetyl-CoA epoxidase subunit PaaE [Phaeacidiphilus oryzae]